MNPTLPVAPDGPLAPELPIPPARDSNNSTSQHTYMAPHVASETDDEHYTYVVYCRVRQRDMYVAQSECLQETQPNVRQFHRIGTITQKAFAAIASDIGTECPLR